MNYIPPKDKPADYTHPSTPTIIDSIKAASRKDRLYHIALQLYVHSPKNFLVPNCFEMAENFLSYYEEYVDN